MQLPTNLTSPLAPVAQTPPQLFCQLASMRLDDTELSTIHHACLLAVEGTQGLVRGSGKPFSCHLVGVASLVAEAIPCESTMIVAGLLHALYQRRVSARVKDETAAVVRTFGPDVDALVHAYQQAGSPEGQPLAATRLIDRQVRILQLADQLEDGLDGGPWWHGAPEDAGVEPGCAQQRVQRFLDLHGDFEEAPALGAPTFLERYRAIRAAWAEQEWPVAFRSGRYSSFRVQ